MIEIKNTSLRPDGAVIYKKLRDERVHFYKVFRKTNREQHLIHWKKFKAEFKSLAKKDKKEDGEKFASFLNSNTPINQACKRVRQLKGNDRKKVNILEANGTQYKDSKSIVDKIGDTLAELSFPQNYDYTFLDFKPNIISRKLYM